MVKVEATFIIEYFEKEMKICKSREKMESRIFILGEIHFRIRVYPRGCQEEYKNHVSLFIDNDSNTDVKLTGNIHVSI